MKKLGADDVIDYKSGNLEEQLKTLPLYVFALLNTEMKELAVSLSAFWFLGSSLSGLPLFYFFFSVSKALLSKANLSQAFSNVICQVGIAGTDFIVRLSQLIGIVEASSHFRMLLFKDCDLNSSVSFHSRILEHLKRLNKLKQVSGILCDVSK